MGPGGPLRPKLTASDGRLLLAQPVVAGEELFAVPRARILTASTVRELSDFLDAGVDVVSPPPPPRSLWLPLWLSYERHRPDSPHAAYLAALPTAFHLPFLWSPAERAGFRWVGAELLSVQGQSVEGLSFDEAISAIIAAQRCVRWPAICS